MRKNLARFNSTGFQMTSATICVVNRLAMQFMVVWERWIKGYWSTLLSCYGCVFSISNNVNLMMLIRYVFTWIFPTTSFFLFLPCQQQCFSHQYHMCYFVLDSIVQIQCNTKLICKYNQHSFLAIPFQVWIRAGFFLGFRKRS